MFRVDVDKVLGDDEEVRREGIFYLSGVLRMDVIPHGLILRAVRLNIVVNSIENNKRQDCI